MELQLAASWSRLMLPAPHNIAHKRILELFPFLQFCLLHLDVWRDPLAIIQSVI